MGRFDGQNTLGRGAVRGIALLLAALAAPAAQAGPIGLFNGALDAGWTTSGDAAVITGSFGVTPIEGSGSLILTTMPSPNLDPNPATATVSGTDAVDEAVLEGFFGFAGGELDTLHPAGKNVFEGSGARVSFSGSAGATLSFRYKLLTNETDAWKADYTDFAFWSLRLGAAEVLTPAERVFDDVNVATLANTLAPLSTTPNQYDRETAWQTVSYTLPSSGTYTLGIGVADAEDRNLNTALVIDDVNAPEPGTGVLTLTGLAWLAIRRSRSLRA